MSTTLLRPGARTLGALLLSAALVGAPTAALAAETPTPTATATATPDASPSVTATPEPSATATPGASETATSTPEATATPEATDESPSPTATATASGEPTVQGLVPGGDATRYGIAAAAGPATSGDPVLVGANYLEEQLREGDHHFSQVFGGISYADYGVTADAVLALAAAGTGQDEATLATQYLADHVVDYASYDDGDPDTVDDVYAGSVAKLLNVAVAQGVDPTAFGGWDLVATLQDRENAQGRFVDRTTFTDYSNTFGQAFAVIGLQRSGAGVSDEAVAYLLAQQCPGGAFKLYESDDGCTTDADADPDATAMAVQALLVVGGHSSAAGDGLDYLTGRQDSDGGVGGGGPTTAVNANSTGLAGQAFLAGGRTAQARAAVSFLTSLQYGCEVAGPVRGAVAYDQAAHDAAVALGGSATPSDQDRRSTSQALLALAGVPLGAVTATGADAQAPTLACAAEPTSSPTATPTSTGTVEPTATTDPTESSTVGAAATTDPAAPVAAGATGALAQTGASPLLPVLLGLLLVAGGGAAVYGSRRRGAHA